MDRLDRPTDSDASRRLDESFLTFNLELYRICFRNNRITYFDLVATDSQQYPDSLANQMNVLSTILM